MAAREAEGAEERAGKGQSASTSGALAEPSALGPWRRLARDLWGDQAVIQPLGAWFLTALFILVAWLTIVYAPAQFIDAAPDAGPIERGVIPIEWGYLTIAAVTAIALLAGLEPILAAALGSWWRRRGGRWLRRQIGFIRWPLTVLGGVVVFVYRLPSTLWSAIDAFFARVLAPLAGAALSSPARRYGVFLAQMAIAVGLGLYAPPEIGLPAVLIAIGLIVAVARRWSWVERDRERFLIERSRRNEAELAGFDQDLRDEALVGLVLLFVLTPLALAQLQGWTCAAGDCAFELKGGYTLPPDPLAAAVAWLGFFGAELAKSVPFVDWSEVFHVANDSPIEAGTPFGAQVVFLTRAGLDLLLLASVLQAVQIAGRLRAQADAFEAAQLPILDQFAETARFARLIEEIRPELALTAEEHPAVQDFPPYETKRLRQIVENRGGVAPDLRRAAAALLWAQHPSEETDRFFGETARAETDAAMRRWLERTGCGLEADAPDPETQRPALKRLLSDRGEDWRVRAAAARAMGDGALSGAETELLMSVLGRGETPKLRADAGVALARQGVRDARAGLERLAESFSDAPSPGAEREAAQATGHALALLCADPSEAAARGDILGRFKVAALAERGLRIQGGPISIEAAKSRDAGYAFEQRVRIAPGEPGFAPTFRMGATEGDPEAAGSEKPSRDVQMVRAFELGRYAVTFEEYRGFTDATGRDRLEHDQAHRWPALRQVSWRDALAYCAWLGRVTGAAWTLPTEAEWEYACRAGTKTVYSWGDAWDPTKANNALTPNRKPRPVEGQPGYEANEWGLWQMHGNIAEWCRDPWHDSYAGAPETSRPWLENGDFTKAVQRGGSWFSSPRLLRSANRGGYGRDDRDGYIGFRVARVSRTLRE